VVQWSFIERNSSRIRRIQAGCDRIIVLAAAAAAAAAAPSSSGIEPSGAGSS